jgi:voltage-gated sodium channel
MIQALCEQLINTKAFKVVTVSSVALAGIVVGLETSKEIMAEYGPLLRAADRIILAVFVCEIMVRIAAVGSKPWRYFQNPWNIFDFTVVVLCLLPMGGNYISVLRLVRTLRLLRLLTVLPKLQMIVGALLKSIPSIGYVSLLLGLQFYIYAVLGVFLFGANDPVHFGSLGNSMLTLFQVLTLEGWADIMRTQIYGCAEFGYDNFRDLCTSSKTAPVVAAVFFVSFIIVGTMIILNLFIGVIMSGMQELEGERERNLVASIPTKVAIDKLDIALAEITKVRNILMQKQ